MTPLDLLEKRFYGASLTRWLLALATLFAVYLVLSLSRRLLKKWVGKWAQQTETEWDDLLVDLIDRAKQFFLVGIALFVASRLLPLRPAARDILKPVFVVVALVQA